MWAIRILLAITAIAWADRLTAREYAPSSDVALSRPQTPLYDQERLVPCLTPQEALPAIVWILRDKEGNVLIIGSMEIRQRC